MMLPNQPGANSEGNTSGAKSSKSKATCRLAKRACTVLCKCNVQSYSCKAATQRQEVCLAKRQRTYSYRLCSFADMCVFECAACVPLGEHLITHQCGSTSAVIVYQYRRVHDHKNTAPQASESCARFHKLHT